MLLVVSCFIDNCRGRQERAVNALIFVALFWVVGQIFYKGINSLLAVALNMDKTDKHKE